MKRNHSAIGVCAAALAAGAALLSTAIVQANDVFQLSFTCTGRYQTSKNYANGDSTDLIAGSGLASQDLINLALGDDPGTKQPVNIVLALKSDCLGDFSIIVYDKTGSNSLVDIADGSSSNVIVSLDTQKEVCTGSGTNQTCNQPTVAQEFLVDVSFNSVGTNGVDSIDGGVLLTDAKTTVNLNSGCPTAISATSLGAINFTFTDKKGNVNSVTLLVTKATFATGKKIGTL
jgi:hypothetical protein